MLLILAVIYVVLGILAAYTGYRLGRKALKEESIAPETASYDKGEFSLSSETGKYSFLLLISHVLLIAAGMYLMNTLPLVWGMLYATAYVLFCLLYYPGTRRRLRKPGLWIQLLLVVLLASFFIGTMTDPSPGIQVRGIFEGLEMSFRAVMMFMGFSALSIEIRNPLVKMFLVRKGFENLYLSLSLSFSVLPGMVRNLSSPSSFLRNPVHTLNNMIRQAGYWLDEIHRLRDNEMS